MKKNNNRTFGFIVTAFATLMLMATFDAQAQQRQQVIQATAMGTSTQLGRIVSVDLRINEYSTDEDRAVLLQVFTEKGSEGLANALDKMRSMGRIAITGTLGFDVSFIRSIPMPDGGRKIRFITDRPISFSEAWSMSRSMDYSLSMGEIILSKDNKNNSGVLYPAARLTLDGEKEITLTAFQNPWRLQNIRVR